MGILQVIGRARNLCSKPGLSDSRLQALSFWAELPLLYAGRGQKNKNKEQNRYHPCPSEHLILTYPSFSFLCAG